MARQPRRAAARRKPLVEELEARLLFSADAAAVVAPVDVPVVGDDSSQQAIHVEDATGDTESVVAAQSVRRELVFVDAGVEDHESLVADLRERSSGDRRLEVVLLDAGRNGIEQIGEALADHAYDLDAVHVLSHGSDGEIQLGNTFLSSDNLSRWAESIAGWGHAFAPEGDLLLYGCDLASGGDGVSLVDSLAALTGADVAASTDTTGAAVLGGDWDLEHRVGRVEAAVAPSAAAQAVWMGTLDVSDGLVAHLTLDETSGTTASDRSGNGNDGNVIGAGTWTAGQIANGLSVDYTDGDDYVEIPNSPTLENVQEGDFSLAAWVRANSTPPGSGSDNDAAYALIVKEGFHTGLYYGGDNRFHFDHKLAGAVHIGVSTTNTFAPGGLHHVAGVLDRAAGTLRIYVDGILENTTNFTPGAASREYGTVTWKVGMAGQPGWGTWKWAADATIDDVRIYDRALPAGDVTSLASLAASSSLWLTTEEGVSSPSGVTGLPSWSGGELIAQGGTATLEPGTTGGTFSSVVDLDAFTGDSDFRIDSIHYVGTAMTVGSNSVALQVGDLLLSGVYPETLNNSDLTTTSVTSRDVFIYRPDTVGDYTGGGAFIPLIVGQDLLGGSGVEIEGVTLVESTVTVGVGAGATTLNAGDFLFTDRDDTGKVFRFQPGVLGDSAMNTGTITTLVDANNLGVNQEIHGVEIVESAVTVGDRTLYGGQILISTYSADSIGGTSFQAQDVVLLDITSTGPGAATQGSAEVLFQGADVGFNAWQESIWGIALRPELQSSSTGSAIWSEGSAAGPETAGFDGSTFGPESNAAATGTWKVMQGAEAPTRDEKIIVGVDDLEVVRGQIWNGTSWAALPFNDLATVTDSFWWGFDVAYESQSGDALLVWNNGSGGAAPISYRVWNGSSWSAEQTVTTPAAGEASTLQLVASPDSDEMVLVVANAGRDDYALVWDGSSWGNGIGLDFSGGSVSRTDVSVAYEQQSGHAMVVYGDGAVDARYRIWNGSSWSSEATVTKAGGAAGEVRWATLASDPNSDRLALGVVTNSQDVWLRVWDGSAWEPAVLATTSTPANNFPAVAVAFESASGNVLATYAEGGASEPRYRVWSSGIGWSGERNAPDIGHVPNSMTLDPSPTDDAIMLSVQDSSMDAHFVLWNGTSWGTPSQLETDTTQTKNQPFLFLWDRESVNVAPVLTPGAPSLTPIDEDAITNSGDLVSSILSGTVSDGDGDTPGIAITGLSSGNGTWQYRIGAGPWLGIGPVSATSALLLGDGDGVRFVPDGANGESPDPSLTYHAWDQSSGTAGTKVDPGTTGGSSAFSTATDTASIAVASVNDAPVRLSDGILDAIDEDDVTNAGTLIDDLVDTEVSDVDVGALKGIAITGVDETNGVFEYTLNGTDWFGISPVSQATARLLPADGVARIRFVPDADYNGISFPITYRYWDQTSGTPGGTTDATPTNPAFSASVAVARLEVNAVNDAPTLGNGSLAAVNEDDTSPPGATISSLFGAGFSDVDGTFSGVAVVGNAAPGTEGVWQYSSDGGANWANVGTVADGATALAIQSTSLLRFLPAADYNGTPSDLVLRGLDDSYAGSWSTTTGGTETRANVDTSTPGDPSAIAAATSTLSTFITSVNDSPSMGNGSLAAVNEDETNPPGATVMSLFGAGFSDVDGSLAGVAIVGNAAPGSQGVWQYSSDGGANWANVGTVADGATALAIQSTSLLRFLPAADYNGTPSDLVLRGLDDSYAGSWSTTTGGTETRANVDTSTPGDPSAIAAATSTLSTSITSVNDSPSMGNGSLAAVDEDDTNPPGATVASLFGAGYLDVDGTLAGVAIVGNAAPGTEGVWQYSSDGGANWANVGTVADDATALAIQDASLLRFRPAAEYSGTPTDLVLRGLDDSYAGAWSTTTGGTETRANVDTSVPGDPSPITAATSTLSTSITAVNDAPTLGNGTLAAVLEDETSPPGATVSSLFGAGFSDPDGTFSGVAIVGNAAPGTEGVWQYSSDGGANWADVGTVADDATALAIQTTSLLRFRPAAEYSGTPTDLVLRGLDDSYAGAWSTTTGGTETRVNLDTTTPGDPSAIAAAVSTLTTSVTSDPDPPVITTNFLTVSEGGFVVLSGADLQTTDPDGPPASSLVYTVSGVTNGYFDLLSAPGIPTTTFTQQDVDTGQVRFFHDGGEAAPTYSVLVDDGTFTDGPHAAAVTFTNVNDAPQNLVGALPQTVVSTTADGATSVHAADVDGDGDVDLVSSSWTDDEVTWYQNDGAGGFTTHTIATGVDGARHVSTADVDGDGDLDVLAAASDDDEVIWYENDGTATPGFTAHTVSSSAVGAWYVSAADVDGDGDTDLLSASIWDNEIIWYENDGAATPSFTEQVISNGAVGARAAVAADMDGDGDMDVVSASFVDDKIAWYENDGTATPGFTEHVVSTSALGAQAAHLADVDGDGDMDILSASYADGKIAWYENDGAPSPTFTERVITTDAAGARDVTTADLDGDGDLDVLSASFEDDKVAWYESDGAATPSFTEHRVADGGDGPRSVVAADLDGDGDLDVASASLWDDEISVYENPDGQMASPSTPEDTPLVFSTAGGTALSIADPDLDGNDLRLRLEATNGTVTLAPFSGLVFLTGDGTDDAVMEFTGSLGDVNAALDGLSFRPAPDFVGVASLRLISDDQGFSGTGGVLTDDDTVNIQVLPVNDAPSMGNGSLAAVNEDDANPPGATVASLFGAGFLDVDGVLAGVAIVGNTAPGTEGVWQYSSDGGANWAAVGTVADGATALAIRDTSLLRFLPAAEYSGTPTDLVLRGLDDTYVGAWSTTTGGTETRVNVDTSVTGDPSAITAATSTLSTSVTTVNDAPTLGDGSLAAVLEDDTSPPGATVASLFGAGFNDPDGTFAGIAIVGNAAPGTEGVWQYSSDGGANWADVGTVTDGATALAIQSTSLLRFLPAADYDGTPTDLVLRGLDDTYAGAWSTTTGGTETRVQVDTSTPGDPSAIAAATSTLSTSVTPVNDSPTLGNGSLGAVLEDDTSPPGATVASLFGAGFSDPDGTFSGIAIVGNAAPGTEGAWQYSSDGGANWADVGTVADGASALALQSTSLLRFLPAPDYDGTPTDLVLRGLDDTYAGAWSTTTGGTETRVQVDTSTPGDPSAITAATSTLSTSVTAQNDAPVLGSNALSVAEGGSVLLGAADLSATDVDDSDPLLQFTVGAVTGGRFELVSAPGTPIFSFFQGDVTAGQVRFVHDGGEAAPSYTVTVSDGGLADGPAAATVTFSNVNDAPTISGTTPLSFTNDKTPASPFTTAVIDDVDLPGDVLTVEVRLDDAAKGALTGGFTSVGGGVYRFTGSAGAATAALQGLSFVPTENRVAVGVNELTVFTLSVDDGTALPVTDATTQVSTTSMNDAPTVADLVMEIPENTGAGTLLGTVSVLDPDPGDTHGYAILAGNTGGAFFLDPATGELTVANPAALDFDTNPVFTLLVEVTDGSAAPDTATVTVNLSQVIENLPQPEPPAEPPVDEPPPEEPPAEDPGEPTETRVEPPAPDPVDVPLVAAVPPVSAGLADEPGRYRPANELAEPRRSVGRVAGSAAALSSTPASVAVSPPLVVDDAMLRALDLMGVEMSQSAAADEQRMRIWVGAGEGAIAAVTAGFLTWFLRTGTLLTSLLSSLPMWSRLDPLPVLMAGSPDAATGLGGDEDEEERGARRILDGARPTRPPDY